MTDIAKLDQVITPKRNYTPEELDEMRGYLWPILFARYWNEYMGPSPPNRDELVEEALAAHCLKGTTIAELKKMQDEEFERCDKVTAQLRQTDVLSWGEREARKQIWAQDPGFAYFLEQHHWDKSVGYADYHRYRFIRMLQSLPVQIGIAAVSVFVLIWALHSIYG